jgi:serine/threonine-protein kinase
VLGVSWEDADAYGRWLTEREASRGGRWVYDLPTEEEWEKAARGVDGRKFPWGDLFDWRFCRGGWSREDERRAEAVGRFARDESPWGVRDLGGNVAEWCSGWSREGVRPHRGGTWTQASSQFFRAAYRSGARGDYVDVRVGFRVVARR